MSIDPSKKFYPANMGFTPEYIVKRIVMMTAANQIPNFGQAGLTEDGLIQVMEEGAVQEFVDMLGELHDQQYDPAQAVDGHLLYNYQWAKFAEELVEVVHHRGGPD